MSPKERQLAMTETCPNYTTIIRQILGKHNSFKERITISIIQKSEHVSMEIRPQEFWKKEKVNNEQENLLYDSVRLFTKNTPLDSITVIRKFVENPGSIMECIESVSSGKAFWNPSITKQKLSGNFKITNNDGEKLKNKIYDNFPNWFSPVEGGTIYEWLCAFFEQTILCK